VLTLRINLYQQASIVCHICIICRFFAYLISYQKSYILFDDDGCCVTLMIYFDDHCYSYVLISCLIAAGNVPFYCCCCYFVA